MPSLEAKRRKARRRAERKAERPKKQLQRWINLPKDLYPYEALDEVPVQKSVKETREIITAQQYLPWPIKKARHPCRPWRPEDLWEIGALKKALFNELESCGSLSLMPLPSRKRKEKEKESHRPEDCLHHIMTCWNANLGHYDSVGPSFLIHILKRKYHGHLTFASLVGEDSKTVRTLKRAAPTRAFHMLLGRLRRTAHGVFGECGNEKFAMSVQRTECLLQDLVHAGSKEVSVYPCISEVDLLDELYFEDEKADKCDHRHAASWTRTVLIIVPDVFIDEFIGGDDSSPQASDEDTGLGQTSQQRDHDDEQPEEEFECRDEEAILERAQELSQQRLSLEGDIDQDVMGSDVEVQDEHGNTYMMPASMFEESFNEDQDRIPVSYDAEDTRPGTESVRALTLSRTQHANKGLGTERWSVTRVGSNSLVRTRRRLLLE